MSEDIVLTVSHLEKSYPDFQLGPANLQLMSGYVYAVMGENGSGKSTLFRLLNGIIQPQHGEIQWLDGGYGTADQEVKLRVAYIPDELDIPDTGWSLAQWRDFVSFWYPDWNGRKYRQLVERYGLQESKPMNQSSKGMQRKAALVMALSQEPEVLLLDEPSAGLDPFAWRMMMEDLIEYMSSGKRTIMIATHIMEEIRRLGDYIFFLQAGRLLGPFEKDALNDNWRMLWINRLPGSASAIPGVVAVEDRLPVRLVTRAFAETEEALLSLGIEVADKRPLELDEIFWHLLRMKEENL